VWQTAADYNGCLARFKVFKKYVKGLLAYYYLQQAVTPDMITQQNSLQIAGGP
jgi:hypothetical protein